MILNLTELLDVNNSLQGSSYSLSEALVSIISLQNLAAERLGEAETGSAC